MLNVEYPEKVTWVSLLKKMLFDYGFSYVWMWQYVDNDVKFLSEFKQRLHDLYIQEWRIKVDETNETSPQRL